MATWPLFVTPMRLPNGKIWRARINLFTLDGVFVDNSVGATYRGRALADPVRNYGTAFSNMHRELYRVMCSNSKTARSNASTATQRGRSFLLNSGS
jgi:hypothetical protein